MCRLGDVLGVHLVAQPRADVPECESDELAGEAAEELAGRGGVARLKPAYELGKGIRHRRRALFMRQGAGSQVLLPRSLGSLPIRAAMQISSSAGPPRAASRPQPGRSWGTRNHDPPSSHRKPVPGVRRQVTESEPTTLPHGREEQAMLKQLRALRATSPGAAGRRRRFFPRLETLESRAVPATFVVTTTTDVVAADGRLSLREAISAANAHLGPDTILLPPGVYRLALAGADDTNVAGDFDVTDSTLFQGAGAGATVIDGQQIDRVFDVRGTAQRRIGVTFQGLTVRNGLADAGGGGGIRAGNADLLVQDCVISGNRTSGDGGGISNAAQPGTGNVTLVRTTVERNVAGVGGGIRVVGGMLSASGSTIRRNGARLGGGIGADTAILTGCTVSGNFAFKDARGLGGGSGGLDAMTAILTNCAVTGNTAAGDEAGFFAGTATLTNCTVSGNTAGGVDGGFGAGTVKLTNCTVSGNHAGLDGGGIDAQTVTLINSTVSGNIAGVDAGGIFATNATLTGSTVSGNHAGRDAGGLDAATSATLTNSTVSGNTAGRDAGGIDTQTATLVRSTVSGNIAQDDAGGILASTATLTGCTVSGNTAAGADGGGIHATTATLTQTVVSGNHADNHIGGGLFALTATLTDCTVSGNTAALGGGIHATTRADLNNCAVRGNTAGAGGGLDASTATLVRSTVSGNAATTADGGGGILAFRAMLTNSTVSGNHAAGGGGGIFANSAVLINSTVSDNSADHGAGILAVTTATLTNSTVSGNTAAHDGGRIAAPGVSLSNSTVSGNSAGGQGGGINVTIGLTLLNVTVTDNSAHVGGGIFYNGEGSSVRNSIIAGNLVDLDGAGPDVSGTLTSGGHNLIGNGSGSVWRINGVLGDTLGTDTNPIDPRLGPLADNGGPTKTHALLPGSPAIDHGDNADVSATDQRGAPRARDGDGNGSPIVDIGAFER
jgi:predicted outer membrane repeat protein